MILPPVFRCSCPHYIPPLPPATPSHYLLGSLQINKNIFLSLYKSNRMSLCVSVCLYLRISLTAESMLMFVLCSLSWVLGRFITNLWEDTFSTLPRVVTSCKFFPLFCCFDKSLFNSCCLTCKLFTES